MNCNVTDCKNLPPGNYSGIWSGYSVKVSYNQTDYQLTTDVGIRGKANASVSINKDGKGRVSCS